MASLFAPFALQQQRDVFSILHLERREIASVKLSNCSLFIQSRCLAALSLFTVLGKIENLSTSVKVIFTEQVLLFSYVVVSLIYIIVENSNVPNFCCIWSWFLGKAAVYIAIVLHLPTTKIHRQRNEGPVP